MIARGRIILLLFFLLLPASRSARAHVGSPNVFFEGSAGPYPVRVVVRPPGAVPGRAEITVRVEAPGVRRVAVLPVRWDAGRKGAPPPDEALPVRGEAGLYSTELWLMDSGSYSVFVDVEGDQGSGTAIVPVNSVATRRLEMSPLLGGILAVAGLALFLLAVSIVAAAAREGTLEPGAEPGRRDGTRARLAGAAAAFLLGLAAAGGKAWWDAKDREFRNNSLFEPVEVSAAVRVESVQRIARLDFDADQLGHADRTPLMPDHGKMMHMFLIREPELDAFAHVHPIRAGRSTFDVAVPPLPAGRYRLYADVTHESGFAHTLTGLLEVPPLPAVPGGVTPAPALDSDSDDSWHVGEPFRGRRGVAECRMEGGFVMVWKDAHAPGRGKEAALQFTVVGPGGEPARLEPYMGMLAHAAVRRDDGAVFAHLHPTGTVSMASLEVFAGRERASRAEGGSPAAPDAHAGHEADAGDEAHAGHRATDSGGANAVTFPYELPRPGLYRIWVQVKVGGKVLTGVFDTEVGDGGG